MTTSTRFGVWVTIIAIIAFFGVSTQESKAQTNDKRVERSATGVYKGKTVNSKNYFKQNGVTTFVGTPENGEGKMRVPVKDGGLRTTARDGDIGGDGKAKFNGREKKSNVAASGKKIRVVANGKMDVVNDGENPFKNGKVAGRLVKRGNKWVSDVKVKGDKVNASNPSFSNSYVTTAKGKN